MTYFMLRKFSTNAIYDKRKVDHDDDAAWNGSDDGDFQDEPDL